jgi:Fur family peroxide stress response transcriptional regulator
VNYSYQRETVLTDINSRCDHPTAAEVYETVRRKIPNISLATVYRNLTALSKNGDVISFYINGTEHFDGNVTSHIHFTCEDCGRIYDVFSNLDSHALSMVEASLPDVHVKRINVLISGLCESCKLKTN